MEQEQAREEERQAADRPVGQRARRRAVLVARIRAANAETLERLAEL
ncbi:hypothetical protein Kpho02_20880 [Kitasatospora phosalacinea]|uniref:Uncharacterized protein n=1 Tax=Kitasatospora phosalacinea TaxID=2065 RepID=A0A9W6Q749_9ACTN|nr:hypothetical protein [Kitasatospora phosalacinea]GLW69789.1 hypothetical protein Kpho02_20880 [Kitasatospora phosalacinea]